MAASSLIGRRIFLAAASRATQRQAFQATSLRAASSTAVASSQQSYSGYNDSTNFSRFGLLAAAGASLAASGVMNEKNNAKCCGIAGVVGAKGDARDYLIEGLTILKNRGYDSAGIATMTEENPSLVSDASTMHLMSNSAFQQLTYIM